MPMALAQACSVSGPSVPSCCTFSPVRKSSRVKRNLQRTNQPMRATLPLPPEPEQHQAGSPDLLSACPRLSGRGWGHGWGYLSVGPGLVSAWWALLTPREMRSPLSMWPRGSVHFSVSKKSRALSREHHVRWKSAGMGGQWHWGGHHAGCPPALPTLTLFALPGPWELRGGRGPVQVPAVCHWLGDLVVDALWTRVPRAGAPCGTRR